MKKKKNYKPAITIAIMAIVGVSGMTYMTGMPKPGISGGTKADEDLRHDLRVVAERIRTDVIYQCDDIGRRSSRFSAQQRRFDEWMEYALVGAGFEVTIQEYSPGGTVRGKNIVGTRVGKEPGAILIGTHYDSYGKSPCANATATAVATITETLRDLGRVQTKKTVIVAFFGTGERPHRGKSTAGSAVWLKKALEDGVQIDAALLVGSFGTFIDGPDTQNSAVPWNFVTPDVADWVGVYGDLSGREFVTDVLDNWGAVTHLPARGFATPTWLPGIQVEDQVAFQEAGIQSVLFSDTGYQRMQSIRTKFDNAYEIDYVEMARRVQAFSEVALRYAGAE